MNNAAFVAVCPLFNSRIRTERDLRSIEALANTYGLYWMRVWARQAKRKVLCYGKTPLHNRYRDVWRVISHAAEAIAADGWPEMITRKTALPSDIDDSAEIHRYLSE